MTYIYDIYLNFKSIPFDFFDWNKNDTITHIKRIPLFIVNNHTLKNMIINAIKIDKNIFKYIESQTITYSDNLIKLNCALFTDKKSIIAIMFDNEGLSIKRSFLIIDEELDILDNIDDIDETKIEYITLKKIKYSIDTRNQLRIKDFIKQEIRKCENDKLKYIYFECFNEYEKDINKIKNRINKLSSNNKIYKNLYYVLKITSSKK